MNTDEFAAKRRAAANKGLTLAILRTVNDRNKDVKALLEANSRGKASALKPVRYLINYRLSVTKSAKGTRDQRYNSLIELIEALKPVEVHRSTSTYDVRCYLPEDDLIEHLSKPLDAKFDFLLVTRMASEPRSFGNADLDP